MRRVCLTAILSLALGCAAKQDHSFVSVGESSELGPGGSSLSPWGDCLENAPVGRIADSVVQVAPPPGAQNVSVHTPMMMFMEEGYDLSHIDAFDVTSNGWGIDGDLMELERDGSTVIGFAPLDPYDVAGEVKVEMEVDGTVSEWQFHTGPYEDAVAGNPNLSFENPATAQGIECEYTYFTDNFIGFGDVAFTDAEAGDTSATDGESRLLMSTGEVLGNASVRGTTSFVTSQPLPMVSAPTLLLDYQFISETSYEETDGPGDSFLILAHGEQGMVFEEIANADLIAEEDMVDAEFPGLVCPLATEWTTHVVSGFNQVGANATISLFVTDVGSTARTSAVSVDNLRVE